MTFTYTILKKKFLWPILNLSFFHFPFISTESSSHYIDLILSMFNNELIETPSSIGMFLFYFIFWTPLIKPDICLKLFLIRKKKKKKLPHLKKLDGRIR